MNRNVLKPFFFVAVLVLVVGLACGIDFGTEQPAPGPVIQPSPQTLPQTQPTTPPQPTAVPQSTRFFKENFDGNADNWKPFVTSGELSQLTVGVKGGYYSFDFSALQVWGYAIYTPEVYSDVRIEAVAENRGKNNNNVTLVCRYNEADGWYEASIANNGLWWLYYGKWDNNHKTASYSRIYNGGSNDIRQGQDINTYTLICQGRTLTLMINGIEIHKVDDNKYVLREGNVGIGVSSFNTLPIKVEFDSVEISEP